MMCQQGDFEDAEESDTVEMEISSKDLEDLLDKAVTRARKRRGLSKSTLFSRINVSYVGNDPFSGMVYSEKHVMMFEFSW